ncbi:hypothetical protein WOLCODRAFT_25573 [Wolfiporia cocos MD-104 SS10]|uniref:Protein kinase domain-containing protein n=1 Tax=Wolfiporia cocos (strain MD-104) TaxID=742152 RepID=A0A2H3K331_WOLCO|nr:hypothetical protein WOLCODRAFT_25573 [Wolfiporia cocos MD-104 SS10]
MAHPSLPSVLEPESAPAPEAAHAIIAAAAINRHRGLSNATIRPEQGATTAQCTRVASNPLPQAQAVVHRAPAAVRSRSSSDAGPARSVSPGGARREFFTWRGAGATPPHAAPAAWWGHREPWAPAERKQRAATIQNMEGWARARERVAEAAVNVLGIAGDVTHEALLVSAELLKFAPLPGLEVAARALLDIWDAMQQVDVNRVACLRLTERCATILYSVREEIAEAGNEVGEELLHPIARLVESFTEVHKFLHKQNHRPFIKRYLKRDEIQRHIQTCDQSLNDALGMFSLSIQIRILKQVLKAEEQRREDTTALLERLMSHPQALPRAALPAPGSPPSSSNALQLTTSSPSAESTPPVDLLHARADQIRAALARVTAAQNAADAARDTAELRAELRAALAANSDAELLRVLQVGRDEMPEAIKALQRALEAEVAREQAEDAAAEGDTVLVASVSAASGAAEGQGESQGAGAGEGAGKRLSRSATVGSVESRHTASSRNSAGRRAPRDTLDREFMESGIDALRRLSTAPVALPSWTITRFEVDREEKVGIGFFSDVYRGTWAGRTVAIKVLVEATPKQLFVHEATIWKELQHPNVLELLGASSASADPPYFFVSPYYRNGTLVSYLRGLPSLDAVDIPKRIHEIAKGMAYLHEKDVLHGDLKGANILVDDGGHCVITDFGQSEMKSEAYRISGEPLPHGTLRWQAPELMAGQINKTTPQIDVYAFAMCCIEVLMKGSVPWPLADDDSVRHFVLRENMRPPIPVLQYSWRGQLAEIINACWQRDLSLRPPFARIVQDIDKMRQRYLGDVKDSPMPRHRELLDESLERKSPDMHPIPLPPLPPDTTATYVEDSSFSSDESFRTARGELPLPPLDQLPSYQREDPFMQSPSPRSSSRTSSAFSDAADSRSDHGVMLDLPGYESPPPADERFAEIRNERRYRMLLQHEFHPSLTLPLWTPTQTALGAVGYLAKPAGEFVTLFNAFKPYESSDGRTGGMASIEGYGRVSSGSHRQDKRSVAQRGMDMIQSWLSSRSSPTAGAVSRRYSSPLRAGHKVAHLFTESTAYRYVEDLGTPKRWFKANVDAILKIYGEEHRIQREDIFLVIGTLEAQDYALHVSHTHPDGQLNFNVSSAPKAGQKWGHFTTTNDVSSSLVGGPVYLDEPIGSRICAERVSTVGRGGKWDAVLLARLRFKTDSAEPTSL